MMRPHCTAHEVAPHCTAHEVAPHCHYLPVVPSGATEMKQSRRDLRHLMRHLMRPVPPQGKISSWPPTHRERVRVRESDGQRPHHYHARPIYRPVMGDQPSDYTSETEAYLRLFGAAWDDPDEEEEDDDDAPGADDSD